MKTEDPPQDLAGIPVTWNSRELNDTNETRVAAMEYNLLKKELDDIKAELADEDPFFVHLDDIKAELTDEDPFFVHTGSFHLYCILSFVISSETQNNFYRTFQSKSAIASISLVL
eukprot:CAMPEP_0116075144 /NCGR_PEP_ID=MMETSP0322-20121206/16450_1 /TAXON_ID=163516 /ORGANISM="Leptocylindrus danicus var. apora, Strain B651" /LENGTH=114 /DNA_ID=CAMNT_0003565127 /DNA_START=203 /DNA_END=543 /DNA_ORIENTATION=-